MVHREEMETKKYIELQECFSSYLSKKGLRRTEERFAILKCICDLKGHFDVYVLHRKMEEVNYHVSRATVYNTIEVLVECGLVVRHQFPVSSQQYELRAYAETHSHLICMQCGAVRELKNEALQKSIVSMQIPRFTSVYHALYIYGLCQKCSRLQAGKKSKNINE